jgi:uncharacterized protein (DUF58 family)
MPSNLLGKLSLAGGRAPRADHRLNWTREGVGYVVVWLVLLGTGLYQQINLVLLIAGLAAGPVVSSVFASAAMLKRLRITRRPPPYAFSGDPLIVDYTLENTRAWSAALAIVVRDSLAAVDRATAGPGDLSPRVFFARVPGLGKGRVRWEGAAPRRGRYRFEATHLVTRAPFGLLERWITVDHPENLVVYPRVGRLSRRWRVLHRESTETRRGRRHDRSARQQEYHGLRDYRPGDSPRWIHWRTTARLGEPMIKEFEQQSDQDLAILLDPWLPRTKVSPAQREAMEEAIRFAATLCLETCRSQGRRLLLGWTGAAPGVRHGPASVKLLHEMLEQLAVLRPATEGQLSALFDAMPAPILREALLVIVSTRPVNLAEEADRSARLSGASGRGLAARAVILDALRGDLDGLVEYAGGASGTPDLLGPAHPEGDRDRPIPPAPPSVAPRAAAISASGNGRPEGPVVAEERP